ncbi:MAG: hypothetical protein WC613_04675 [Candidatus Aenigmatarchaeota archaeon]
MRDHNIALIDKFLDSCLSEGIGNSRIKKYRYILTKLSEWLDKNFDEVTKEDIQGLVRKIEMSDYKDWTKLALYFIDGLPFVPTFCLASMLCQH